MLAWFSHTFYVWCYFGVPKGPKNIKPSISKFSLDLKVVYQALLRGHPPALCGNSGLISHQNEQNKKIAKIALINKEITGKVKNLKIWKLPKIAEPPFLSFFFFFF